MNFGSLPRASLLCQLKCFLCFVESVLTFVRSCLRLRRIDKRGLFYQSCALRQKILRLGGIESGSLAVDPSSDSVFFLLHHDPREEIVHTVILVVDATRFIEVSDCLIESTCQSQLV